MSAILRPVLSCVAVLEMARDIPKGGAASGGGAVRQSQTAVASGCGTAPGGGTTSGGGAAPGVNEAPGGAALHHARWRRVS